MAVCFSCYDDFLYLSLGAQNLNEVPDVSEVDSTPLGV